MEQFKETSKAFVLEMSVVFTKKNRYMISGGGSVAAIHCKLLMELINFQTFEHEAWTTLKHFFCLFEFGWRTYTFQNKNAKMMLPYANDNTCVNNLQMWNNSDESLYTYTKMIQLKLYFLELLPFYQKFHIQKYSLIWIPCDAGRLFFLMFFVGINFQIAVWKTGRHDGLKMIPFHDTIV